MRRHPALLVPLALLACPLGTSPAVAQNQADQTMYLQLYDSALRDLEKETSAVAALQAQLEKETDVVHGCGLLNESLTHLKASDKLLDNIETYTDKLRRGKDNRAAKAQRAAVAENIKLKEGDIARLCANLPPSS
jgi:hypothetical protein